MTTHLQPGDTICLSGSTRLRRDELQAMATAVGLRVERRPGHGVTCVRGLYSLARDRRRPRLTGMTLQPLLSETTFVYQCERLKQMQQRRATAKIHVAAILRALQDPPPARMRA